MVMISLGEDNNSFGAFGVIGIEPSGELASPAYVNSHVQILSLKVSAWIQMTLSLQFPRKH